MPKVPAGVRGAAIVGWATALPDRVVTNQELSLTLDTTDEWIRERTGISERRVGGSTSELAIAAGRRAIEHAGLDVGDIDAVVLATTTPDRVVPATSATVQHGLGVSCGAFDLNAGCSGWLYALVNAHGLIALGADRVLLIGADTLTRVTDWTDRNTAVLFGDGAGAVVLEVVDGPGQLLGWDISSDGSAEELLYVNIGGKLQMEGREVFRRAVHAVVDSAKASMAAAGVTAEDIMLIVPHQANIRIIAAACARLGIDMGRAALVLDRTGNTSSASVPLALADALDNGRVAQGDLVLLAGFGAGMTAASAVVRWSAPLPPRPAPAP